MGLKFATVALALALQGQAATLLRIASGGPGGTDTTGNIWSPDANFNSGATWTNCGSPTTPPCPPSSNFPPFPALAAPYVNLRYAQSFSYTLQVAPGYYIVTLAFIEPNKTAVGQRLFNVLINGQQALSSFDVFQASGGALKPIQKAFPVVAASGTIQIQFTALVGNAIVSGVELDQAAGPPGPLVPIQMDSYQVICSAQPPQNCTGKFALVYGPIGRIFVFVRPPGSLGSLLLTPDQYVVGPPDGAQGISVTLTAWPVPDNTVVTLVYPAYGPASAIGTPQ